MPMPTRKGRDAAHVTDATVSVGRWKATVRYADGPTAEVEVHVAAPPARVWALLTDIDLPARFSGEFRGAEWLEEARAQWWGLASSAATSIRPSGPEQTISVVVVCEPARTFRLGASRVPAGWRPPGGFELTPGRGGDPLAPVGSHGAGAVRARRPPSEARPDKEERIIENRLSEWYRDMRATVDGIKQLAEGGD